MFRPVLAASILLAGAVLAGCGQNGDEAAKTSDPSGAGGVQAAAPSVTLPNSPQAARWIEGVRSECTEAGGQFRGIANHLLPGDFNGDGRPDYVLLREQAECVGPGGQNPMEGMWGNAGPPRDFLISTREGGYRVYDGFSRAPDLDASNIVKRGDRHVIVLNGTWFQPGGEVHKVIWGWTGEGMAVVERQDARGRPVDEDGYPVQAGGAPSGALPFREGGYRPYPDDPEWTASLSITATRINYGDTVADYVCRVDSRQVNGPRVRMTMRCGECADSTCRSVDYGQPETLDIQVETPTIIRLSGSWEGRYRYQDAN